MTKTKRLLALLTILVLMLCIAAPASAQSSYKVQSSAVVLMDADNGEILFQKNMNSKMYPASITKVLTGLLVVEHCFPDETVSVSASAARIPSGYSHVGLRAGDTLSVEDAMYAMMLPSANDAANALAEHVAGSKAAFSSLMNSRARELGARSSSFDNPSGMPSYDHYTTAYDMALITRAAVNNSSFMRYYGATGYTLPAFNAYTKETRITGYQQMMLPDKPEYHPDVTGGKIGYTAQAGHTMTTVAQRDGKTLICVVLGSSRDAKYKDTQVLIDYGFTIAAPGEFRFYMP